MGCIYIITCIPTGKYYVGKTVKSARGRWWDHCSDMRRGINGYLQRSIRKYGTNAFVVETLSELADKMNLGELEKLWILLLDSQNRDVGMNLTSGGEGIPGAKRPDNAARNRRPWTDERRAQMSVITKNRPSKRKGLTLTQEHRDRIAASMVGNTNGRKI